MSGALKSTTGRYDILDSSTPNPALLLTLFLERHANYIIVDWSFTTVFSTPRIIFPVALEIVRDLWEDEAELGISIQDGFWLGFTQLEQFFLYFGQNLKFLK